MKNCRLISSLQFAATLLALSLNASAETPTPSSEPSLRSLAVIAPRAVEVAGITHQEKPLLAVGREADATIRILETLLNLEAGQRGFFHEVPEFRVDYAWAALLEAYLPNSSGASYSSWTSAVTSKTRTPKVYFRLSWANPPKALMNSAFAEQVRKSPASWQDTVLEWDVLPQNWEDFRASLKAQLNRQYLAVTRKRALDLALAIEQQSCRDSALHPSPREIRDSYLSNADEFKRQTTRIGFTTVQGSRARILELLNASVEMQKKNWADFQASHPKATRPEVDALRSSILSTLMGKFSDLFWKARQLEFPAMTGDLTAEQKDFALKAPLGTVLLPNTLELLPNEMAEIWMVTGESRDAPYVLGLENPEAYSQARELAKSRLYFSCSKSWIKEQLRTRVHLHQGLSLKTLDFDPAIATIIGGDQ